MKVILFIFALVLVGSLGYFVWQQNTAPDTADNSAVVKKNSPVTDSAIASWKTYTNTTYKFSIMYPTTWTYREFPDTKTGAGFRLATNAEDPSNEFINIDYLQRALDDQTLSFENYVKVAAIHDIEGFEKLVSSTKVTTDSGVVGYTTTWQYRDHSGALQTSGPITYFPLSDNALTGSIQVSGNVQATPISSSTLSDYNKMVKTFKFTN